MPAPTKRTRSSPNPNHSDEESEPRTPTTRRSLPRPVPPITTTINSRPTFSRASTTLNTPSSITSSPHLTRSNSFAAPSPRRAHTSLGLGQPSTRSTGGGGGGGSGTMTLIRNGSTSSTPSTDREQLKNLVTSGSGGSGQGPKGENGNDDFENGGKRFGKGKENIPPRPDEEVEGSRKRLRVGSGRSTGGRGRSGSVISVRSESSSTRHTSGPASSSSYSVTSRRTSRLPSPSPSVTTATSFDSSASPDPLDMLNEDRSDDNDVDRTPTKSRAVYNRRVTLPTPPPSSPMSEEVDNATLGMGMIRMRSASSVPRVSSRATSVTTTGEDEDLQEFQTKNLNPYKKLKSYLRLSSSATSKVDETVVGRDEEKRAVRSYLSFQSDQDVGMYVSGPPGTGKTALVTALGREIGMQGWKVVEIGCMGLKVGDMWRRIGEELGCGKSEGEVRDCIEQDSQKTLIILDEIDSLLPPPPSLPLPSTSHLLSKLFTLPLSSTNKTTIKLISISNTLDLTIRARLVLPEGNQPIVLPFKAYGSIEMTSIINSRIERSMTSTDAESGTGTAKVDNKAVELLCRKVEAQNGDLRMCLGVLGSAVNLAEAEWIKKSSNLPSPPLDTPTQPITPLIKISLPHILKALTSHTQQLKASAGTGTTGTTSSTGRKIRSVPLQGKMVLVSMIIYLSRLRVGLSGNPSSGSGLSTPNTTPTKSNPGTPDSSLTTSNLYATYTHILSHHTSPLPPASESDYRDLLSNLETLGIISLGSSTLMTKTQKKGKIELCVREEEIRDGLGLGGSGNKGVADVEVGKVFEREDMKVQRAKERIEQGIASKQLAAERMEEGF